MMKIIIIYSKKTRAIIAGPDWLVMTGQVGPTTSATRAQGSERGHGYEHWALQALAEDMAARHSSTRQADTTCPAPGNARPPPGVDAET